MESRNSFVIHESRTVNSYPDIILLGQKRATELLLPAVVMNGMLLFKQHLKAIGAAISKEKLLLLISIFNYRFAQKHSNKRKQPKMMCLVILIIGFLLFAPKLFR